MSHGSSWTHQTLPDPLLKASVIGRSRADLSCWLFMNIHVRMSSTHQTTFSITGNQVAHPPTLLEPSPYHPGIIFRCVTPESRNDGSMGVRVGHLSLCNPMLLCVFHRNGRVGESDSIGDGVLFCGPHRPTRQHIVARFVKVGAGLELKRFRLDLLAFEVNPRLFSLEWRTALLMWFLGPFSAAMGSVVVETKVEHPAPQISTSSRLELPLCTTVASVYSPCFDDFVA